MAYGFMNFHEKFNAFLKESYPRAFRDLPPDKLLAPQLLAPFLFCLPESVCTEAEDCVKTIYRLKRNASFLEQGSRANLEITQHRPRYDSVLSSFDFHWSPEQGLKLIEINTNASLALIIERLLAFYGYSKQAEGFINRLRTSFERDFQLATGRKTPSGAAIVDDQPEKQRMYLEFWMYQEIFERWGWPARIADTRELQPGADGRGLRAQDLNQVDLVYNRDTDFYFENQRSQVLRKAYLEDSACVTPNPFEYFALADKRRLIQLRSMPTGELGLSSTEHQKLLQWIPETCQANDFSPEELWKARKRFFFKPAQSFGSKAVYRGRSISRKVFEEVLKNNFIAQEAVPPGEVPIQLPDGRDVKMKFDLRFFVYNGEIQLTAARFYLGQLTNFKTLGGGAAPVIFHNQGPKVRVQYFSDSEPLPISAMR